MQMNQAEKQRLQSRATASLLCQPGAVVVFDLDDTLVRYTKKGARVPRETWHALRRLWEGGVSLFIVSYDPLASFLVGQLGLFKYIDKVVSGRPPRTNVIDQLAADADLPTSFFYVDDRPDNIDEVKAKWPGAIGVEVDSKTTVSCPLMVRAVLES